MHELARLCGSMALLVMVATFAGSGIPSVVYAWTIPISSFTYTPVTTGGNTTISWYASSAQYCTLSGPTLPCVNRGRGGRVCSQTVYGTNPGSINIGNVSTGPITRPTSYTLSCYSPAGCSWWCNDGSGSASLTVYPTAPTPTTLTSLTASPSSVVSGTTGSTLTWTGAKGSSFSACELTGGQWGSGTWFTALPGSIGTNALSTNTTYSMDCFDTTGASTGWKSATVTVTAPASCANGLDINSYPSCTCPANQIQSGSSCITPSDICTDIPGDQASLPSGCTGPVPSPVGSCVPAGYSWSGSACVPTCSNGLNASYSPGCTCPAHQYQPLGALICVALPICANGLSQSYSPSCTCQSGQVQSGSTCVLAGVINTLTANPSRVLKGKTATVAWSTSHMATCSLSGFAATGTSVLSSALSSSVTPAITGKTIYTLTCTDQAGIAYSSSVTVNLVPQTIER